jgi:hypothetical protein
MCSSPWENDGVSLGEMCSSLGGNDGVSLGEMCSSLGGNDGVSLRKMMFYMLLLGRCIHRIPSSRLAIFSSTSRGHRLMDLSFLYAISICKCVVSPQSCFMMTKSGEEVAIIYQTWDKCVTYLKINGLVVV